MLAGITLALLATMCFASGNALEKRGVDRLPPFSARTPGQMARGLLSSSWWLAGAAVSVVGLLAQILAFSHVAISIVQSIGVGGVVLLVVIARVGFGERLHRRELVGLSVAVASLALVALSLTRSADAAGTRGGSGPVLAVTLGTLLVTTVVLASPRLRRGSGGFAYGAMAGLLYGLSGVGAKGMSTLLSREGWYGVLRDMWTTPYPYVFVGAWAAAFAIFQLGIQRYRVGVVGAVSSVVGSVFIVAVGTPVFGERLPANSLLLALRLVGFVGILCGGAVFAWGGAAGAAPDSVDLPGQPAGSARS